LTLVQFTYCSPKPQNPMSIAIEDDTKRNIK